ncbi:MAG TPA: rhodanese-like domain-containing protein, partial [Thermoanaerobaculia bacterium]|nr:rhodanese-like domain-containing protein [Thermoanaerobaculia bacterium]
SLDTSTLTATSASNTPPPVTSTTATNATTPPVPLRPPVVEGDKSSVERIAPEDLKAKWDRHEVTVIDVRDEMSYKASHIRGALHMQFAAIEGQIDMIPKGKPIVLYCT